MEIRINQQFAKIGLNIQKPFLPLHTTHPKIELDIKEPRLNIHSPRPKVYIDQRECFADMDKRTPLDFIRYWTQIARSAGFEAIGEISAEGDMLAAIEKGVTIEDLAVQAMDTQVDFNVTAVPKQPPKIDWDIRPVEINLERGYVDLTLNRGQVENYFQWGKVQTYIEQKNFIEINWVESKLDALA